MSAKSASRAAVNTDHERVRSVRGRPSLGPGGSESSWHDRRPVNNDAAVCGYGVIDKDGRQHRDGVDGAGAEQGLVVVGWPPSIFSAHPDPKVDEHGGRCPQVALQFEDEADQGIE